MHRLTLSGICTIALVLPFFASAESVVWNGVIPSLEYVYTSNDTSYRNNVGIRQNLYNPNVSVQYEASVFEISASGSKIRQLTSGETVPNGTRVLYEFRPHEYNDIVYVGTGGISDTPYGVWASGATLPSGQTICGTEYQYGTARGRLQFAVLSGNPPGKSLGGLPSGCTTASDGVSKICTLNSAGTVTAEFMFHATNARFYAGYTHNPERTWLTSANPNRCEAGGQQPMYLSSGGAYDVAIPAQTISHTVTVTTPVGTPPATPTLNSGGACTVGTPHTITMSATDPDGDNLRYGVDWNADGSVDEHVPPSGYVSSGTSQSATRTYATTGTKTVKVMAQDDNGLSSGWTTLSFNCADVPEEGENKNNQCLPPYICHGNDIYQRGGAQCTDETFVRACSYVCSNGACLLPPGGNGGFVGNISVSPSLIRQGNMTNVRWATNGMTSCSVTENNPDIADTWTGENGTEQSSPISQQTVYTLSCDAEDGGHFTDTATVSIIPVFKEK